MINTPFERNILPRFASWFLSLMNQEIPDYLIPVERKGAHLLDAVLRYLRQNLGVPVRTQVIYRRALFFTDPSEMQGKTAYIVDDATRSGRTLDRYRNAAKACGNPTVRMIACLGATSFGSGMQKGVRDDIDCFMEVPTDIYREYLRQITELVILRGLPPEVDHHVFSITPTGSLSLFWEFLLDKLAGQGELDIRGGISRDGIISGATLHWPIFFKGLSSQAQGFIQHEGVIKIRLFADFARNCILAMPMVFPKLVIALPESGDNFHISQYSEFYDSWHHDLSDIGRTLIDNAHSHADGAELLYNSISLSYEVEMIKDLAALIADSSTSSLGISFSCERDNFYRLYGARFGDYLVTAINKEIDSALQGSRLTGSKGGGQTSEKSVEQALHIPDSKLQAQINSSVNRATDSLLVFLKSNYHEANIEKPEEFWETVGYSFSELLEQKPFSSQSHGSLLLSRCIDFGLSLTSLVPYLSVDRDSTLNAVSVTRKYRTAEQVDYDDGNVEDIRTYSQEIATETVATVAYFLKRRSRRWKNSAVPLFILDKVLAIIDQAMPKVEESALTVIPQEHGPEAAYQVSSFVGPPTFILIRNMKSECYSINTEGFLDVTPVFEERYNSKSLHLSHRQSLVVLESYLSALVPLLDESTNVNELLTRWGISSGGKLGLDYAMYDIDLALKTLMEPLEVFSGGGKLDRRKLSRARNRAHHFAGIARKEKIEKLEGNWEHFIRERWDTPIEVESDLLSSLLVPKNGKLLIEAAKSFCLLVTQFADLVGQLSSWATTSSPQIDLFTAGSERTEVAAGVLRNLLDLELRLRTMRAGLSYEHILTTSPQQEIILGRRMKQFVHILKRFAGAYSWSYSALRRLGGEMLPDPTPRNRVILFADIAGSTPKALTLEHRQNVQWKNDGLNLIAQWGNAFGGREITDTYPRKGDDIVIEFTEPDSAILCGAMIQEHISALRSTSDENLAYRFRMAVDAYWLSAADGGNTISLCIDRAAKLAKAERDHSIFDPVWVTPEIAQDSSEKVRDSLLKYSKEIDLGAETSRARFTPCLLDRTRLISEYIERLHG